MKVLGWTALARTSNRDAATITRLKKAIAWLKETGKEVRNARLAPFAEKSDRVWEMLRQESNVELGPIRLEGTATQRRVSLDVTVDGVPGAASLRRPVAPSAIRSTWGSPGPPSHRASGPSQTVR